MSAKTVGKSGKSIVTWHKGFNAGSRDGRAAGWNEGYRIGRSHAIYTQVGEVVFPIRPYKVLYVTAGIGDPYPALDQAIIEGLRSVVIEVMSVSPTESVVATATLYTPDVILVLNGVSLPLEQVDELRQRGFRTAVWFTDDPYYTDWTVGIAPHYDHVFTLELNCVSLYQSIGCTNVYYLPFAVNPKAFYPIVAQSSFQTDICFIGTAFWNRVRYIDQIAHYLKGKRTLLSGWWWDRLHQYQLLSSSIRLGNWLTPGDTSRYYNGAKIVINLHRPIDDETNRNSMLLQACSVNPRTFEISGCSTLQLVDARSEVSRMYVPNQEIVIYSSPEELVYLLDYYLNHEEERREIAFKAYNRTLRQHTYAHRLDQMMSILFE
ncbi:glycosyltransferase [Paenibacillus sp. LMG 31460]|uniref:Glycosyltransferase n=1 Tax=Paenibacillus germinis TaxID=2654979 RepID=A0ABX1ZF86_9BACL|nr:glycosyltransferase [Paenibacillus germinis]NOU90921.1 glycosyltransferase [Paenibacillus germinis]